MLSEPLKKISNSSVSSPCPSPIPQSISTINNTGNNSRSNSPATQQRLHLAKQPQQQFPLLPTPQGINQLQHSPLFQNQLATFINTSVPPPPLLHQMQQQHMMHHQSSDISLNLQKSSLITINQQKYRTISTNQNEEVCVVDLYLSMKPAYFCNWSRFY